MKDELKDCPFCGGEAESSDTDIFCTSCYVNTACGISPDESVKNWNARAPQSEWVSVDGSTEFYKGSEYHIITDEGDQYYAEFDGADFECAFMGNVFIPLLAVEFYMLRPTPPKAEK